MEKLYYVAATKINARIADTVVPGYPIHMDGYLYEKVRSAPRGRRILRRLLNTETQTRIVIYS
jgi:hypothetical protein